MKHIIRLPMSVSFKLLFVINFDFKILINIFDILIIYYYKYKKITILFANILQ